jgi:hypothetical protein
MRKVSIKGVLIGGFVDVATTTILAIPLVIYAMAKLSLLHAPRGSVQTPIAPAIHASPLLYVLQLLIGLGGSVLGGYVAAWIARHDELLNGLLSSLLCTVIGVYSVIAGKISGSLSEHILLLIAAPFFGFLGGYLRRTQKHVVTQQA